MTVYNPSDVRTGDGSRQLLGLTASPDQSTIIKWGSSNAALCNTHTPYPYFIILETAKRSMMH